MPRPRHPCLLVVLLACAAVAAPSTAQSISGALSGNASSAEADREQMTDMAVDSFRARGERLIHRRLTQARGEAAAGVDSEELRAILRQRVAALRGEIAGELDALGMDGFLGRDEASRAIGSVAETMWLSFEDAVDARRSGHGLAPRPSQYESTLEYAWDMAVYVVRDRNGLLDYGLLLAAIAGGVLVAWLCSRLLVRLRTSLAERDYRVLATLVNGVRGPLYVTLAVAGVAIGLRQFWLPQSTEWSVWLAVKLAFIGASLWLTWCVVNLAAQGLGWMLKRTYQEPDRQQVAVIRKSLQLVVLVVFAIVIAEVIFGVELQSVLIGVGLLGLAVTLAAQDSLKNLFGSLTIVVDRPFRVGDLIEFKGFFGTVEDIGFRSTRVRDLDGHLVSIPNAHIVSESVQNVDARPWIRRRFRIALRYDTPADKVQEAMEILRDVLAGRSDEPEDAPTQVLFEGFADSHLAVLVQYCVEPGDYWEGMTRGSELHLEILRRFDEAGIDFAFPTRTAVLEAGDTGAAELLGGGAAPSS